MGDQLHRLVPISQPAGVDVPRTQWRCANDGCGQAWDGMPALDQRRGCTGTREAEQPGAA